MAGRWHQMVVRILNDLCKEWVQKGKYKRVHDGNIEPIYVSYRKQAYPFRPDLYAIRSDNEKTDIYEVIDTESEGEAVMDLVYSALTPHINDITMVCADSAKLQAIKMHAQIILNKIFSEDGEHYLTPTMRYFVHLPREARVVKTAKEQLRKQLQF